MNYIMEFKDQLVEDKYIEESIDECLRQYCAAFGCEYDSSFEGDRMKIITFTKDTDPLDRIYFPNQNINLKTKKNSILIIPDHCIFMSNYRELAHFKMSFRRIRVRREFA